MVSLALLVFKGWLAGQLAHGRGILLRFCSLPVPTLLMMLLCDNRSGRFALRVFIYGRAANKVLVEAGDVVAVFVEVS